MGLSTPNNTFKWGKTSTLASQMAQLITGTPNTSGHRNWLVLPAREHRICSQVQSAGFWSSRHFDQTSDNWLNPWYCTISDSASSVCCHAVSISRATRTWSPPWSPCCKDDIQLYHWSGRILCLIGQLWFIDFADWVNAASMGTAVNFEGTT